MVQISGDFMRPTHIATTHLEHLYQRDIEVKIGDVTANHATAIGNAYGYDGKYVGSPCHLDILTAIKEGGSPRQ